MDEEEGRRKAWEGGFRERKLFLKEKSCKRLTVHQRAQGTPLCGLSNPQRALH